MGRVKIDKDDKSRILLTEILPYEVPMLFSNEGFYSIISNKKLDSFFGKIKQLSKANSDKKYGIPFNYEIRKNIIGDTRTLSIIHPYCQTDFIDLYDKYDNLMLHLCSKSPFSLRKISKVSKFYYSSDFVYQEDPHKNEELEVEPEILDRETKYIKSYFTYKPIDLIYKFYEKTEFQRLEQRFNYLMEFDISKCFYHIYTHSITWAVKNKEMAKRNAKENTFENIFDKIMQLANYNETNGILVGPEISRIFAEIILQQIDINVLQILENCKIKYGIDFEIKRYVDDYFVFSNDEMILFEIKKAFQKELEFYKLYLNPNKSETKTAPFITNITVAKRDLKQLLNNLYESLFEIKEKQENSGDITKQKKLTKIRRPYSVSQNFIKDFQCVIKRNNLSYDVLSKDVIRFFKTTITKMLKDGYMEKDDETVESVLLTLFDILFYAYSLNINSGTTFKLSQIIVLICKLLDSRSPNLKHTIYSKISKDADFVLTNFQRKSKISETNVETLNLLIALKKMGDNYIFSERRIKELFNIKDEEDIVKLNYFHLITLLYYINDNTNFSKFKLEIENSIILRFREDDDPFSKAELTMLFFDFICCPFTSVKSKIELIQISKYSEKGASKIVLEEIINNISSQTKWFMDWDIDIDLERVLKKKEWGASY